MNSINNTINLLKSLVGKRLTKIICCIDELDVGQKEDYSFDYCLRIFFLLDGLNLEIISIDVGAIDSILAFEYSDLELAKILSEFRSPSVEFYEIQDVQNQKIVNVDIKKKVGFVCYGVENEKTTFDKDLGVISSFVMDFSNKNQVAFFSGDIYETKNGFEIVSTGEMILVETKETKGKQRNQTPIPPPIWEKKE